MTRTTEITKPTRYAHSEKSDSNFKFFDSLSLATYFNNRKLNKAWYWRNVEHGDVFTLTLDVPFQQFQQDIFIEDSALMVDKLRKIGFKERVGYPTEDAYKDFSHVMYNTKHNIAIHLYDSKYASAINTAINIVTDTNFEGESGTVVFLSAVKTLIKNI